MKSIIAIVLFFLTWNTAWSVSEEWVGSQVCEECHQERHESWYATYHRTMTQEATPSSVQGKFDGREVTAWGVTVRPVTRNGQYWFDYHWPGDDQPFSSQRIYRTVGSHRYQQYLTKAEGMANNYYRLHLLWHIEDQRWVHMNAVFLGDDNQHFDNHVALWNHNCIFCHNTGPEPNLVNFDEILSATANSGQMDLDQQALYQSEVAELGISCETCHGPAANHVQLNQNPIKRWWNKIKDSDNSIINPDKLNAEQATQVCGQCHGQRIPRDSEVLHQLIRSGPPYRAGDDLNESMQPVWRHSEIPGDADQDRFKLRFWSDGTARLTAYEYQGLLQSACYTESQGLSCNNCHSMHAGNPSGMLTDWQAGNGPCLECHTEMQSELTAHTQHAADSEASQCYSCHMPKITYGVMTFHRSHRIELPKPQAHAQAQRPNACNQCHLDKTAEWAQTELLRLWPGSQQSQPVNSEDKTKPLADGLQALLAGDPVQRGLAAWSVEQGIQADRLQALDWIDYLFKVLQSDDYPAVRRFSHKALLAASEQLSARDLQSQLQAYDFTAAAELRERQVQSMLASWQSERSKMERHQTHNEAMQLTDAQLEDLLEQGRQRSVGISVGE